MDMGALRNLFITIGLTLVFLSAYAQHDTLRLKNGNVLFGEIKELNSGVLKIETDYSDSDFAIDFDEVVGLSIERQTIIILEGGSRYEGFLRSDKPGFVRFDSGEGESMSIPLQRVNRLWQVEEKWLNRLSGNIDIGFNLTKADNNRQITASAGLQYAGLRWVVDGDLSTLRSERDQVDKVERTSASVSLTHTLSEKWYVLSTTTFLSNTEQALDGRFGFRLGAGRFLAISNKLAWGLSAGLNYNWENFQQSEFDRQSTEAFISTDFNMFDFKDFRLKTALIVFPSLSERGRFRADYNIDLKYDLPWDFYIKVGFQFNYDNQAVIAGGEFDFVLTSGVGWSFD